MGQYMCFATKTNGLNSREPTGIHHASHPQLRQPNRKYYEAQDRELHQQGCGKKPPDPRLDALHPDHSECLVVGRHLVLHHAELLPGTHPGKPDPRRSHFLAQPPHHEDRRDDREGQGSSLASCSHHAHARADVLQYGPSLHLSGCDHQLPGLRGRLH